MKDRMTLSSKIIREVVEEVGFGDEEFINFGIVHLELKKLRNKRVREEIQNMRELLLRLKDYSRVSVFHFIEMELEKRKEKRIVENIRRKELFKLPIDIQEIEAMYEALTKDSLVHTMKWFDKAIQK